MNDLPDLPSLESVQIKECTVSPLGAIIVLLVGPLLWLAYLHYRYLASSAPDLKGQLLAAVFACAAVFGYGLLRIFFGPHYWNTDTSGFHIHSLLRRRYLRWEDNTKFPMVCSKEDNYTNKIVLAASIWQHVRRYHGADAYELPKAALSFWNEIPDTIPSTIDWEDPRHIASSRKLTGVLAIVGLMAIAALWGAGRSPQWHQYWDSIQFLLIVLSAIVAVVGIVYIVFSIEPERLTLDGKTLQVQLKDRVVSLDPSDITAAEWQHAGRYSRDHLLILKTKKLKGSRMTVNSSYKGSTEMMLALIRWLRTSPTAPPVIIPETLMP